MRDWKENQINIINVSERNLKPTYEGLKGICGFTEFLLFLTI